MSGRTLILLSIPGLRVRDVSREATPTLHAWASGGFIRELTPTFPCVTSPVQASVLTRRPPRRHGVIANGFYHRDRDEVAFWVAPNSVVEGECIWSTLRRIDPRLTTAVWHYQNIKGADADYIVTPAPIHEPDGSTKLWCYSRPEGLYAELLEELGHFPLQHYWGPLSGIASTQWILRAALWLLERRQPNLNCVYVPHLDYAGQKFGPESPQAQQAVKDLDAALTTFVRGVEELPLDQPPAFLVVGEYAMTPVRGVDFPNRVLRAAGLLRVRDAEGREHLDPAGSRAFAMVDHQLAHVYVRSASDVPAAVEALATLPGVARACVGADRATLGMDHPRCGEIVLVSRPDSWLAYPWWFDDASAPGFARTVDIHNKPGYDPLELFFDPATKGISLDATKLQGSHGAPVEHPCQRAALLGSRRLASSGHEHVESDTDVGWLITRYFQP